MRENKKKKETIWTDGQWSRKSETCRQQEVRVHANRCFSTHPVHQSHIQTPSIGSARWWRIRGDRHIMSAAYTLLTYSKIKTSMSVSRSYINAAHSSVNKLWPPLKNIDTIVKNVDRTSTSVVRKRQRTNVSRVHS